MSPHPDGLHSCGRDYVSSVGTLCAKFRGELNELPDLEDLLLERLSSQLTAPFPSPYLSALDVGGAAFGPATQAAAIGGRDFLREASAQRDERRAQHEQQKLASLPLHFCFRSPS